MANETSSKGPVLLRQVKPVAFGMAAPAETIDILVDGEGRIAALGQNLEASADIRRIEGNGAWISPGWIDRLTDFSACRLPKLLQSPVTWMACAIGPPTRQRRRVPSAGVLAGTAGIAKRALPGVELLAIKAPDQLDAARALVAALAGSMNFRRGP